MRNLLTCLSALVSLHAASATNYEVDTFTTPTGKTIQFVALTHASIRLTYEGTEIMIDPVRKHSKVTIDYGTMPKADFILVTHEHGDHFDPDAIRQLSSKKTQLVTNKRCAEKIGYGLTLSNGEGTGLAKGITLSAVPAYNNTEGHLQFHPKGRDNGYVLTIDGMHIYIAGDTEDIPEMEQLKDIGIDIAFLPCNQPYTMTPEQLVKAAKMIKPKVVFPYHYGQTDVSGLPEQLKKEGIEVRIRHYE